MAPKKSKSKVLEEEKPKIAVDLSEEEIKENTEALEKAEALTKTIRKIIESNGETPDKPLEKAEKTRKEDRSDRGDKIKQNIEKIKAEEGVIGYILRNTKSASIDLKDPTKIIDFAMLSSSAMEASEELSNTFKLGDVKHILIEGNNVKLLSFSVEDNMVSIFMEKNVDHNRVYKNLLD
jgi:predicted regulator of Ras-like GTPase activity (Roadblock/LC7/MglB family)